MFIGGYVPEWERKEEKDCHKEENKEIKGKYTCHHCSGEQLIITVEYDNKESNHSVFQYIRKLDKK